MYLTHHRQKILNESTTNILLCRRQCNAPGRKAKLLEFIRIFSPKWRSDSRRHRCGCFWKWWIKSCFVSRMCGLRVSKLTRIFIWFLFFDTCLCEVLFKIVFIYFFWGGGADVSFTVLQKTARIAGGERGQKYQYSQAFRCWHDPSPTQNNGCALGQALLTPVSLA